MVKLGRFYQMIENFAGSADFLIIYIEEAHASDGWKITNNTEIRQHRTLDDRFDAARILARMRPPCPIYVDDITDDANLQYGGLYERLYIILDDVVVYEGKRGPAGYKLEEVEEWLSKYTSKH